VNEEKEEEEEEEEKEGVLKATGMNEVEKMEKSHCDITSL
jgi:hypothetical protein